MYYIPERYEGSIYFASPYKGTHFKEYVMKERLVPPIWLLLDPVLYFKRYSAIILKYPELGRNHTLGIL